MMPPSQAATRYPPHFGRRATTRPATISITPTTSIAWWALPGIEVVDLRRQVDAPVDQPVEELVEPEQDRGDGETDAQ